MTIVEEHSHPWFGIQTELKKEPIAAAHLQFKGYQVYAPVYRKQKQRSDRLVEADVPLFPGYLFCRFDSACPPIVTTPGVVAILGRRGCPEPIPGHEIAAIQTMLRSGLPVGPHAYLHEGKRIRITKGPLKGVEGLILRNKNNLKVVVAIELLQRSVAVELECGAVRGDCIS